MITYPFKLVNSGIAVFQPLYSKIFIDFSCRIVIIILIQNYYLIILCYN